MISEYLSEIESIKKHYKKIILDTLVVDNDSLISWPNYTSGISKKLYSKEYEDLKDTRQYSFLLSNQGLVQLYYEFHEDVPVKSKLAYYPYPVRLKEKEEEIDGYYSTTDDIVIGEYYYDLWNLFQSEIGRKVEDKDIEELQGILEKIGVSEYEILENKFNKKYELTNTSHIRIDYDSQVTSHHKCEIQYSSINNVRIPIKHLVTPLVFMDFLAKNEFKEFHDNLWTKNEYKTSFQIALKNNIDITDFSERNMFLNCMR